MRGKVLVVDDDLVMRDLFTVFLTREGYKVIVASNGQEAIEQARGENPQVILLDADMPVMDGVETCKRLKADEKMRSILVIMVTGLGFDKMEAIEAEADDFLTKPFGLAELSIRIKSLLHKRDLAHLAPAVNGGTLVEKRSCGRFKGRHSVTMITSQGVQEGEAEDLSADGAFIYCETPLGPGEKFGLTIEFPSSSLKEVSAEVVWSTVSRPADEKTPRGMGVRFLW